MNVRYCVLTSVLAASVVGCDDTSADYVDDIIAETNAQVEVVCDCFEQLGHESRGECEDARGFIGPSRERCIKDAYADDEAASQAYLECIVPLEREFTACLDMRVTCDDVNSAQPCIDDYDIGARDCIQLPANVERELDACS